MCRGRTDWSLRRILIEVISYKKVSNAVANFDCRPLMNFVNYTFLLLHIYKLFSILLPMKKTEMGEAGRW